MTDELFVASDTYDIPLFNFSCNFNPEHIFNIIQTEGNGTGREKGTILLEQTLSSYNPAQTPPKLHRHQWFIGEQF